MRPEQADLTVFAKDFPETRLVVEIKSSVSSSPDQDPAVRQVVRYMWGANCHYGLIITPDHTYVLRDDFSKPGPESIRVTDVLPTATVFSRLGWPQSELITEQRLEHLAHDWLQRLADSYEAALPDDPLVMKAFFPDIVGAVAEGRVVTGVAA